MTESDRIVAKPGQSLGGLILEGAAFLGERTLHGLLNEAGTSVVRLMHHSASAEQLTALADALDLPATDLISRRHDLAPGPGRRRSYFGTTVDDLLLEKRTRRFAPASLADEPWHRASWQLRMLPFCDRTWTLVTDACSSCGAIQRWSRAWGPELCDVCTTPLCEGSTPEVPEKLRTSLRFAAGLPHHDDARRAVSMAALPDDLRRFGSSGCLDLVCAIAGVVDPTIRAAHGTHLVAATAEPAAISVAIARAWELIVDWPMGILAECDLRLARRVGRHGDGNHGATNALLRMGEQSAVSTSLAETAAELRGIVAERQSFYVDTREFARLSGVAARRVAQHRREGRIPSVMGLSNTGEAVPMLPAPEAVRVRRVVAEALLAERAAARIGCTYRALEEMIEMGLLERSPYSVDNSRSDRLKIQGASLVELESALRNRASPPCAVFDLPLAHAMRAVGGRLKPWSRVIEALHGGEFDFSMRRGAGPLAARIMIRSTDLPILLAMRSDFEDEDEDGRFARCMSKKDAFAVLNTQGRFANEMLSRWATSTGPERTVPTVEVLRLAERHVTSGELAARNGSTASAVGRTLTRLGVPAWKCGVFDRRIALERLTASPPCRRGVA